jgi:bacterioferritin-associated ferredoxin
MIVCVCHRVSDRDIARAVQGGCCSFDDLQAELRVSTSCGKCRDCARETFQHHAAQAGASRIPQGRRDHAGRGAAVHITVHPHHSPMVSAVA